MKARILAALLLGVCAATFGAEFQPTQPGAELPAELQRLWPRVAAEAGPKARALFWQRTTDQRDGEKPAWLVGCGEGAGIFAKQVLLVDDAGTVLARAPEADNGYQTAFVASIGRGQPVLVLSAPAGRKLSSKVTILLLETPPVVAFTCESPAAGPLWNSEIYLVDVDGDETKDLLVEREVYAKGRRTHERLLYRFDARSAQFRETMAPTGWLAKALTAARNNPGIPQAVQYTDRFGR